MNTRAAAMEALERRLGRPFRDRSLLDQALTHASVGDGARGTRHNEVLEFIGDRVIGLLAAERLAAADPTAREGDLAPRLNALVSRDACAAVARRAGLGAALRLSGSETKTGGRDKDSILAGACEALMAAIYQDGGIDAARTAFADLWSEALLDDPAAVLRRDPKTALQEWAQGRGKPLPRYAVARRSGPDHQPVFTVTVEVEGLDPEQGQGRSRQEAEKAAAAALLEREQSP
jgi:ribonuclease-3